MKQKKIIVRVFFFLFVCLAGIVRANALRLIDPAVHRRGAVARGNDQREMNGFAGLPKNGV